MMSRSITSTIVLTAIASHVMATPINPLTRRDDVCGFGWGDDDSNGQIFIWNDNGVGQYLDNWLLDHGETDWAYRLDTQVMEAGAEGQSDFFCDDIGNCPDVPDCCMIPHPTLPHLMGLHTRDGELD
jgi:hypothetical protein